VKRFFGRLGRSVRRTGEKVQEAAQNDDAPSEEPQRTRGEAVGQAAKGLGHRVLGVSSAERRWAREVGVDPYTTNPALRRELERVARWEAGGRITRGVLIPIPALVGKAADVSDLVWESDPDTLTTLNEKRLEAMGARGEASRELRLNGHYTLTGLTLVVGSLHALTGVPGRDDFVLRAGRVSSEDQANSHVESSLLARQFHEQQAPVTSVLSGGPGITVLTADERVVQLLPVEHVVWSEELETSAAEMAWRRRQHPERKAEVWLTGTASERTHRELDRRGWVLRQEALATALPEPAAAPP
jgi:hypothetical protein